MKKIKLLISLTRPLNVLITFFTAIVAVLLASGGKTYLVVVLSASIAAALTAAAGNIINDIYDMEADKINHPRRALAQNLISYTAAKRFWLLNVFFALLFAGLLGLSSFFFVLTVNVILVIYSFKLKNIPLAGNAAVALLTGMVFIYGGMVTGYINNSIIPALFAFLINFIREIVKDIEDMEGDKAAGVFTAPLKYGLTFSKAIILSLAILLILATFIPFLLKIYSIEFFIIAMTVINPLLVWSIKKLYASTDKKNIGRISFLLKLNMAAGLAAIFLGM